jgi:outer membrane beta-barrel protein
MIKALAIASVFIFALRALGEEKPMTPPGAPVPSQGTAAAPVEASDSPEKIDLKPLEDKYWAAKDKDFTVIQNRNFSKDHRFFASFDYGTLINDPYSTGKLVNFTTGYYFGEHWGLELSRDQAWLADNSATSAFATQYGVKPNYNKFSDYTSLSAMWVPLYAKMSAMDKAIWYFDLQFAAGLGMKDYQSQVDPLEGNSINQSAVGLNLDATAHIFFNRDFAIRLELRNTFASENQQRYHLSGSGSSSRDMGNTTAWDTTFVMGLTYFLPRFGSH